MKMSDLIMRSARKTPWYRRTLLSKPAGNKIRGKNRMLLLESLEARLTFAGDLPPYATGVVWLDVNGDTMVTPIDALLIINRLNSDGAKMFDPFDGRTTGWYDCNGDGWVTPIDALVVINRLNSVGAGPAPTPDLRNLPPRGFDSAFTVEDGATIYFVAPFLDPESKPLTVTIGTNHANGNLTLEPDGKTFRYDAPPLFSDTFDLIATDSGGLTATATITINVGIDRSRQHAPFARTDFVSAVAGTPVTFDPTVNDIDVDGNALSTESATQPSNGSTAVLIIDGTVPQSRITYTPNANFAGSDSFSYVLSDGTGRTSTGVVFVNVRANQAPNALNPTVTTLVNTASNPITTEMLGSDSDGDPLTVTFGTPSHGVIQFNGNSYVYMPNANYLGTDTVAYTISDGFVQTNGLLKLQINEPHFIHATLTREEAIVAAVTLSGVTLTTFTSSPYTDLRPEDYGFAYIVTAHNHGWIQDGIAVGSKFYRNRDITIGETDNLLRTVFGLGYDACLPVPSGDYANHISTDDYFRMLGVAEYDNHHGSTACLSEALIEQLAQDAKNHLVQ